MPRVLATLLLSIATLTAYALPTVDDVQHAVHRGDYVAAESLVREVLAEKPQNAKAHYILAELLAHQGKIADAKSEVNTARTLDPEIHFTTPEKFRQFESELGASRSGSGKKSTVQPGASGVFGGSTVLWIVLIGGVLIYFATRRRPNATVSYPTSAPGAVPGGINTSGPPGYYPPNPSSGVGGKVAAGLGGLAAGMLVEHLLEGQHPSNVVPGLLGESSPSGESVEDRPIDFGNGGDWGGDSGGGDAGIDTGGGGDWS